MKTILVVALALVAFAAAAPVEDPIPIVRSEFEHDDQGGYSFGFESGNGIIRSEQGTQKEVLDEENKPHTVVVVRGSYSYPDEEGPVNVNYFADETGFHAEGERIPKPESRR